MRQQNLDRGDMLCICINIGYIALGIILLSATQFGLGKGEKQTALSPGNPRQFPRLVEI